MVSLKDGNRVTSKIIDLGLSKTVAESPSQPAISMPGAFAGTPEFASPEQFAGVGVDIRSDLYSFGVTLWEMLTAKVPFRGTPAEVMYQHQHAPLPLEQLIEMPQPIVVLLQVLLEKDPKWRFQSPVELLNVLPRVADAMNAGRSITHQSLRVIVDERIGAPGKATGIPARVQAAIATRRGRLILVSALALLVAGGLILMLNASFWNSRRVSDASNVSLGAIKPPEKSIAVLPFESLSDNKNDTYFADGIQDEILSNLSKVSQLKVISRTSVMTYRSTNNRDLRSIANALGVANVVEGTVRRDGNRVRVTTELVDARTDQTLWSDSYDRNMTDIFAIQSDVAQTVASKLSAQLSREEQKGMEEKPTDNLEAYDLYLQAKEFIVDAEFSWKNEHEKLLNAIKLLEEATRMDSQFALAYCLIARAHDDIYDWEFDKSQERRALGDTAVNEALRLGPDLPEVHLAAAYHLYLCYMNFERARVQIAIAQRTLPNNSEVLWLAAILDRTQGRWEECAKTLEKASSRDPRNSRLLVGLGATYLGLRRYLEAQQIYARLIELEPNRPIHRKERAEAAFLRTGDLTSYRAVLEALPSSIKDQPYIAGERFYVALCAHDWTGAKQILSENANADIVFLGGAAVPRGCGEIWLAAVQGRHPKMQTGFGGARDQLKQKVEANPGEPNLLSTLGVIDAFIGRKEEAIEEAKRAVEMLPVSENAAEGPWLVTNLAIVYAWTNESELAFRELATLIQLPSSVDYGDLKVNPVFDPLRNDPRFDKLIAQLAPSG
jgi:TolB-like protein/Flp pilus assembly protein TadD